MSVTYYLGIATKSFKSERAALPVVLCYEMWRLFQWRGADDGGLSHSGLKLSQRFMKNRERQGTRKKRTVRWWAAKVLLRPPRSLKGPRRAVRVDSDEEQVCVCTATCVVCTVCIRAVWYGQRST